MGAGVGGCLVGGVEFPVVVGGVEVELEGAVFDDQGGGAGDALVCGSEAGSAGADGELLAGSEVDVFVHVGVGVEDYVDVVGFGDGLDVLDSGFEVVGVIGGSEGAVAGEDNAFGG